MVKLVQPNVPPEWVPLFNKIFRWFELHGIPIWARMWFQDTRTIEKQKAEQSKFPSAGTAWNNLSDAEKDNWRQAGYKAYGYNYGYKLFTADYIWRERMGLSLPGTPSLFHQLFGLKMSNPGGSADVNFRRDEKDLVGQLTLKFSFKKDEIAPSASKAFKVTTTLYYFTPGGYATETDEYSAPAGDSDWQTIERTIGTADREYFHVKIVFSIEGYNAIIYIDNLSLFDDNGLVFKYTWNNYPDEEWEPEPLQRKRYWIYTPYYYNPYYEYSYLE